MVDESGDPYRGSALETRPRTPAPLATAPAPRPIAPLVVLAAIPLYVGLCVIGLAPWGGVQMVCISTGLVGWLLRASASDSRAKATLAALPFPVRLDLPDPAVTDHHAKIREVRISLVDRLDPTTADHRAVEAEAQVEGLEVTMWPDDGVILLTRWRADHADLDTLATLLDTWGRRVHARAPISDVLVMWTSGGSSRADTR